LQFQEENITIQDFSLMVLFPICNETFAQEHDKNVKILEGESGQRSW
jgi:hypothetical protein